MQIHKPKLLIIGHARHGKDTAAEFLAEMYGVSYKSSSVAASEIFLYDALKGRYGYQTPDQCFEDRVNRRAEWHDLICDYNKNDKARLAKDILGIADIYVGMRSNEEVAECLRQGLFDLVIGVFDWRKRLEPADSFSIDIWECADMIIPNSTSLEDFKGRIAKSLGKFFKG